MPQLGNLAYEETDNDHLDDSRMPEQEVEYSSSSSSEGESDDEGQQVATTATGDPPQLSLLDDDGPSLLIQPTTYGPEDGEGDDYGEFCYFG